MHLTNGVTFVEIAEDTLDTEQAKEYLREFSKEKMLMADNSLLDSIQEGRFYSPNELRIAFHRWAQGRLKTVIYPSYSDIRCTGKETADEKLKGSAYDTLQEMIGLSEAKRVIEQAIAYFKVQKLFADRGLTGNRPSMHMVFTGNPGTAKTTVARLLAKILRDNGILSAGYFREVGRADLVGKYVGWTANIVKENFEKAKGGVLFIDEAYSLVDDRAGLYGDEAINTIVQEMENQREDIVVILAGYPAKMEMLLACNPGLRSRIAFHVPFPDYSPSELYEITELFAKNKGIRLSDGVKDKLLSIYARAAIQKDFGNGRFVRNIIEKALMKQASRLIKMDHSAVKQADLCTLVPDDFEMPVEIEQGQKGTIGFTIK